MTEPTYDPEQGSDTEELVPPTKRVSLEGESAGVERPIDPKELNKVEGIQSKVAQMPSAVSKLVVATEEPTDAGLDPQREEVIEASERPSPPRFKGDKTAKRVFDVEMRPTNEA